MIEWAEKGRPHGYSFIQYFLKKISETIGDESIVVGHHAFLKNFDKPVKK